MTRQREVLNWAMSTFGLIASHRDERAARLVEEAIEVAQAERVPQHVLAKILERVYSRPPGDLVQEIGGVAITLDALAENVYVSVDIAAQAELDRVLLKSREHFQKKHAEKVAAGVANLTDVGTQRVNEL